MQPSLSTICPLTHQEYVDPVVDTEGNTYERSAILEWLNEHNTSPITRNPLSPDDLVPNRAIRDLIEEKNQLSGGRSDTAQVQVIHDDDVEEELAIIPPPECEISLKLVCYDSEEKLGLLKISCSDDETTAHSPSKIVCVLDVSYSMDCAATMYDDKEGSGFTLLDIVKHATRTIIESLDSCDCLSVISYADSAQIDLPIMPMTKENKSKAWNIVNSLKTRGSTNLYGGLKRAMDLLKHEKSGSTAIMLLTDGLPNIEPPRGNIPALKRYLDQNPSFKSSINTFGFGYSINSSLLEDIAVTGNGLYYFIPDASFVGTAFVSSVSNVLSRAGSKCTLSLEADNGSGTVIKSCLSGLESVFVGDSLNITVPHIQYGMEFLVLIELESVDCPSISGSLKVQKFSKEMIEHIDMESDFLVANEQYPLMNLARARAELTGLVKKYSFLNSRSPHNLEELLNHASSELEDTVTRWSDLSTDAYSEEIQALLKDFSGQVKEAWSRKDWYLKWGEHYLSSLCMAHQMQLCSNFKDPGVQMYAHKKFSVIRDKSEDIFCDLPPPKPTSSYGRYQPSSVSQPSSAVSSMRRYHNSDAPCFASGPVLLANGFIKDVSEIRAGDSVVSSTGSAIVKCVVATKVLGEIMPLVALPGRSKILVTSWHPVKIRHTNKWCFPCDLAKPVPHYCKFVYSFILEDKASDMTIGEYDAVSLGHSIGDDPIAYHPFLGTSKVKDDISKKLGFSSGFVVLDFNPAIRDPISGLIVAFKHNNSSRICSPMSNTKVNATTKVMVTYE